MLVVELVQPGFVTSNQLVNQALSLVLVGVVSSLIVWPSSSSSQPGRWLARIAAAIAARSAGRKG